MSKPYTLERIKQCLDACEGISDPVTTMQEVKDVMGEIILVTTNEGTITTDVDRVLLKIKQLHMKITKEG